MAPSTHREPALARGHVGNTTTGGNACKPTINPMHRGKPLNALWLAAALVLIPGAGWADAPKDSAVKASQHPWQAYMQSIEHRADSMAGVKSARAGVNASKGQESAAAWDTGLTLSGTYTDYPSGGGTGSDSSYTDLERHAEARVTWEALDFLAHRPARVAGARAQVQAAQAHVAEAQQKAASQLVDESVSSWAAQMQRQALRHALDNIHEARKGVKRLRDHTLPPSLNQAASDASEQALKLQSEIEQRLASLPNARENVPAPPDNYTLLPEQPPAASRAREVASHSAEGERLRARAKSYESQLSPWAQHVSFDVYAGYVQNKVRSSSSTQSGPQLGAKLSIPLGSGGASDGDSHWQAQEQTLAAQAAVQQQERLLMDVRRQWAGAVAGIQSAESGLQDKARMLDRLQSRLRAGAGKNAPEPWQVQLEAARFWSSVADLWEMRGNWVQAVATWSLYDEDYVNGRTQKGSGSSRPGLCSPLSSCPRM